MNQETLTKGSRSLRRSSVKALVATPKPLDFDAFIPWVCNEFEISCDIIVKRIVQDDPCKTQHHVLKTKSHSKENYKKVDKKDYKPAAVDKSCNINKYLDRFIPLTTYYDPKGCLVEIAIVGSPIEISRKLFIAVSLCVPFHPSLAKVTIRNRGLGLPALFELSKLLSHSNITEVLIEDCYVPEGSYELLLERACNLKNLSLRRLSINDTTSVKIAKRLDLGETASKTMLTLDLASNNITDEGAKAFGEMLRRNRSLLHLNLSNNYITDVGVGSILESLSMFSLTAQESRDYKIRRFEYFIKKIAAYKKNEELLIQRREEEKITEVETKERTKAKNLDPTKSVQTFVQLAEQLTREEIGEFIDVFSNNHVNNISKILYCDGNLRLCSLNLAYNNLTNITVHKIYETLLYQSSSLSKLYKPFQATGLIRIVFDGNNISSDCQEIRDIYDLLNKILSDQSNMKHVSLRGSSFNSVTQSKSIKNINTKKKKSIANSLTSA